MLGPQASSPACVEWMYLVQKRLGEDASGRTKVTYPISSRSDLNRSRKMALCAYIARYFEWNGACQNWRVSLVSPHDGQLEGKEIE